VNKRTIQNITGLKGAPLKINVSFKISIIGVFKIPSPIEYVFSTKIYLICLGVGTRRKKLKIIFFSINKFLKFVINISPIIIKIYSVINVKLNIFPINDVFFKKEK
jgi:hypothetical protein